MDKHPSLSDSERQALQDEYSVMPAAISDEGISRRDAHTPGPWKIIENDDGKAPDIYARCHADGEFDDPVCSLYGGPILEVEANARLIALAPEMLQELRKIAIDLECYCDDYSAVRGPCGHCAAVAILAKAEGRS